MDSGDAPHFLRAKEYEVGAIERKLDCRVSAFDPKRTFSLAHALRAAWFGDIRHVVGRAQPP